MAPQNSPPSIDPANYGSMIGMLKHFLMKHTQNLDNQLPARVVAYDAATNQATVQPLVPFLTTDNRVVQRPQVLVPVRMAGAGGFVIYVPVTTGTLGWLKANDRDISGVLQTKQAAAPNTQRKHSFDDAVFEPDAGLNGFSISGDDQGNLVIQNQAGTVKISVSNDGIGINGPANPNLAFDIQSVTKAFAPPRMTTAQKLVIPTPQEGFVVYDMTEHALSFYNGSSWS